MDCSSPDSSVHGISQARILEWIAMPFSRRSSRPRNWTGICRVSCLAGGFFTAEPPGKPQKYHTNNKSHGVSSGPLRAIELVVQTLWVSVLSPIKALKYLLVIRLFPRFVVQHDCYRGSCFGAFNRGRLRRELGCMGHTSWCSDSGGDWRGLPWELGIQKRWKGPHGNADQAIFVLPFSWGQQNYLSCPPLTT